MSLYEQHAWRLLLGSQMWARGWVPGRRTSESETDVSSLDVALDGMARMRELTLAQRNRSIEA